MGGRKELRNNYGTCGQRRSLGSGSGIQTDPRQHPPTGLEWGLRPSASCSGYCSDEGCSFFCLAFLFWVVEVLPLP